MFTKEERSGFKYWFAHWCAYQMTALNLKAWKFKYLFHDIEKPWLKLFFRDYSKVQKWHRKHNSHHLYLDKDISKLDWEAMAIDWECSRFTKEASPLTAYGEYKRMISFNPVLKPILEKYMQPKLKQLGLWTNEQE